ncbi:MAG: hypothetical protein JWP06_690 [Candidatus Saccharibacteria bacterium]|nr:hypothetical protein [Candidatus Saccharibacteria bacterium]
MKTYGVLSMPVGDINAKRQIRVAGVTHADVPASWSSLQPNGVGTALDASAIAILCQEFDDCASVGLKVIFDFNLQYPPAWVQTGIENFVDQSGNVNDTTASGKIVRNWFWTALGRQCVADFMSKVALGLGDGRVKQVAAIRMGGGWYGEAHYPGVYSTGFSFWGFGASMQTGVGLATDQVVCPLPGYIPFSGGSDTNDSIWTNWYLNGLITWLEWYYQQHRSIGFTAEVHVMLPGYGVRSNQAHSSSGYKQAAAYGEDPVRAIAWTMKHPDVWPYCTWLNTADGFPGGTVDSDKSAWKKIYEEALKRNKHHRMMGENTGNESTAGMQAIFSGATYGSALSTASYPGSPSITTGYQGLIWLNYDSLTSGQAGRATLSDLATLIAANP